MKRKKRLSVGDAITVEAIDHTSHDQDGWVGAARAATYKPDVIVARGFYMGEDKDTLKMAFLRDSNYREYSIIFCVLKKAIIKIERD